MTEWIDIAVYAALIVVVWGWLPTWTAQLTRPIIADRNPDWLNNRPDVQTRVTESRWFRRSCLLWGVLSLALLLALQVDVWPEEWLPRRAAKWEALKDLNSALLIVGLVYLAACCVAFHQWLHANIPLAASRRASLERRCVSDFVPPALQYAVYGVVAIHLVLWIGVGARRDALTAAFWGTLGFQFAISGVFVLVVLSAVRRRPGTLDRIFGPSYRRTEVRLAFAAQLVPIVNGAARLYEQAGNVPHEMVERVAHLGLVVLVVAQAVLVIFWSRQSADRWWAPSSHAVRSPGAFWLLALMTTAPASMQESAPSLPTAATIRAVLAERIDETGRTIAVVLRQNSIDRRAGRIE